MTNGQAGLRQSSGVQQRSCTPGEYATDTRPKIRQLVEEGLIDLKPIPFNRGVAAMEKSYTYCLPMDPASVQNRRQREEERIRAIEAEFQEQEPLLEALRAAGERIRHVSELLERSAPYPRLIPILIDHVSKAYSPSLVAKIGRTLAVKEARPYWDDLVRLYKAAPVEPGLREGAKWSLHLALAEVADKAVLSDLIELTMDQRNGSDRLMFPRVLWKFKKDARALRAIEQLLSDPNLGPEASRLLRKNPTKSDRTA